MKSNNRGLVFYVGDVTDQTSEGAPRPLNPQQAPS